MNGRPGALEWYAVAGAAGVAWIIGMAISYVFGLQIGGNRSSFVVRSVNLSPTAMAACCSLRGR